MDTSEFKSRIAEAVHRAVCEVTGTNGCAQCLYYALGGALLLNKVTNRLFIPQIGGLLLLTSPPDRWHGVDMSSKGDPMQSFRDSAFHCWISEASGKRINLGNQPQKCRAMIDLSSRHYPALLKRIFPDLEWNREPPPRYFWSDGDKLPDWIRIWPEAEPMSILYDPFVVSPAIRQALLEIAYSDFRQQKSAVSKGEKAVALRNYRKQMNQAKKAKQLTL
jgi:hypothetical protein